MTELEYFFKRIIDKQKEIGHEMHRYLKKGLSNKDLRFFESQIQLKLPDDYANFLKIVSGVESSDRVDNYKSLEILPGDNVIVSADDVIISVHENEFFELLDNYDVVDDFSLKHVPCVRESATNCYWVNVDHQSEYYGYVLRTTLWDYPEYIFKDITRFFEAICVAYETDVIKMTNENILSIDYHKFSDIQKKISRDLKWTKK
jgi:hypothetical protein